MKNELMEIRDLIRANRRAKALAMEVKSVPCLIQFFNWWTKQTIDAWFYRFAKSRGLLNNSTKQLAFISIFGPREVLKYIDRETCVFYTGENLKLYPEYADHCLGDDKVKLAIGFEHFDNLRYMRMPIWLRTSFHPEWNEKQILEKIQQLRYPEIGNRNLFCALISSHDKNGLRSEIADALSQVGEISYAGGFRHNDDTLVKEYGDNKNRYMQDFIFNICPENSNADGYCTEKVFDSISAGCIPIYWGSYNNPEPDVLNKDAILFWNKGGDNNACVKRISQLMQHRDDLEEMMHQPRLLDGAEDVVIECLDKLEQALRNLL